MNKIVLLLIFIFSTATPRLLQADLGTGCLSEGELEPFVISGDILGPNPGDRLWDFKKLGSSEKSSKPCSSEIFDFAYKDMWDYWEGRAKSSNCAENLNDLPDSPPSGCNAKEWKNIVFNHTYLDLQMAKRPNVPAQPYFQGGDSISACPAEIKVLPSAADELFVVVDEVSDQLESVAKIPPDLFNAIPMNVTSIALDSPQAEEQVCPDNIPLEDRSPPLYEKNYQTLMYGSSKDIFDMYTGNAMAGLSIAGGCISSLVTSTVTNILNTPEDLIQTVKLAYDTVKWGAEGAAATTDYIYSAFEKSSDMFTLGSLLANDFSRLKASLLSQMKYFTDSLISSMLEQCRGLACYNELYITKFISTKLCSFAGEIVGEVVKAVVAGLIIGALTAETGPFAFLTGGGGAIGEFFAAMATKFPKVASLLAKLPAEARMAASAATRISSKAMSEGSKLIRELKPALTAAKTSMTAGLEGLGVPKTLAGEVSSYLVKQAVKQAPGGNIILTMTKSPLGGRQMFNIVVKSSTAEVQAGVYEVSSESLSQIVNKPISEIVALFPPEPIVETIYTYLTPASPKPNPLDWVATNKSGTTLAHASDGSIYVKVKKGVRDLSYKVIPPMSDELADSLATQGLFL